MFSIVVATGDAASVSQWLEVHNPGKKRGRLRGKRGYADCRDTRGRRGWGGPGFLSLCTLFK